MVKWFLIFKHNKYFPCIEFNDIKVIFYTDHIFSAFTFYSYFKFQKLADLN